MLNLTILFGGKSGEHEVSLLSAKSVYEAVDKERYNVSLVGIDKDGKWRLSQDEAIWLNPENPAGISINPRCQEVLMLNDEGGAKIVPFDSDKDDEPIVVDVVMPVMHGTYGEDGVIQGFLEMLDVAYVGAGVLGSAIGMDKGVAKRLLMQAGINVAPFVTVKKGAVHEINLNEIVEQLGLPLFVKPASLGSSVGVSKVKVVEGLEGAIHEAFKFDTKVLIERYIEGRELEVSVLGGANPIASVVGEVVPNYEFYSYEAKYLDENGAKTYVPADIDQSIAEQIKKLAVKAFQALECYGMARVDFFLTPENEVYVNEINTIPGFTKISMYPKLFEASGVTYSELLDRLIQLALERKVAQDMLSRNVQL